MEEIVREGEEIDESIERFERSLKKLRDEEKRSISPKVPKLNFKKLKNKKSKILGKYKK